MRDGTCCTFFFYLFIFFFSFFGWFLLATFEFSVKKMVTSCAALAIEFSKCFLFNFFNLIFFLFNLVKFVFYLFLFQKKNFFFGYRWLIWTVVTAVVVVVDRFYSKNTKKTNSVFTFIGFDFIFNFLLLLFLLLLLLLLFYNLRVLHSSWLFKMSLSLLVLLSCNKFIFIFLSYIKEH